MVVRAVWAGPAPQSTRGRPGRQARLMRCEKRHVRTRGKSLLDRESSRLIDDQRSTTITSDLLLMNQVMNRQQPRRRIPEIQLRVLIVGRANAGKTSILQRVCETTESPIIYRGNKEVVRGPSFLSTNRILLPIGYT